MARIISVSPTIIQCSSDLGFSVISQMVCPVTTPPPSPNPQGTAAAPPTLET